MGLEDVVADHYKSCVLSYMAS